MSEFLLILTLDTLPNSPSPRVRITSKSSTLTRISCPLYFRLVESLGASSLKRQLEEELCEQATSYLESDGSFLLSNALRISLSFCLNSK